MRSHLFSCWYAAPQVPEDARRLFAAACADTGFDRDPLVEVPGPRAAAIGLALSREWGIPELEARLAAAIEAHFEPTWDRARGEFTWGLGLNEPHPRGQYNAFLAAAEAISAGAWTRLSETPPEVCPQVVGVDFPNVALAQARWSDEALHLRLDVLRPDPAAATHFRIVGVQPGRRWVAVGRSGATVERDGETLVVTAPLESGSLRIES